MSFALDPQSAQLACRIYRGFHAESHILEFWRGVLIDLAEKASLLDVATSPAKFQDFWHKADLEGGASLNLVFYALKEREQLFLVEAAKSEDEGPESSYFSFSGLLSLFSKIPSFSSSSPDSHRFVSSCPEADFDSLYVIPEKVEAIVRALVAEKMVGDPGETLLLEVDAVAAFVRKLMQEETLKSKFCVPLSASQLTKVVCFWLEKFGKASRFSSSLPDGSTVEALKVPLFEDLSVCSPPSVSEEDKARILTKRCEENLERRERQLQEQLEGVEKKLECLLRKGRKDVALPVLKQKKMLSQKLHELYGYRTQIMEAEGLVEASSLQSAVVAALQSSSAALKKNYAELLPSAEQAVDDLEEERENAQAVSSLLGSAAPVFDEAQLEGELEAMMHPEEPTPFVSIDQAPAAPSEPLRKVEAEKKEERPVLVLE